MSEQKHFTTLREGVRVWAVGAIHGEAARLVALHELLATRLKVGDELVYLGGYLGHGAMVRETVDELLRFRRAVMALPGNEDLEVVYLRGQQEEIWQKLLQLQFASSPGEVLDWMLNHGAESTVRAYGGMPAEGFSAAREGTLALTKWTGTLRNAMRVLDGHMALLSSLKHAAFTETALFVHAGVDPSRPLSAQTDSFWWGGADFDALEAGQFQSFTRIVRGCDSRRGGLKLEGCTVTLDSGAGFGGPVAAACFAPSGDLLDVIES
jgi:serine/threonine protein phosphatase 1